jgi:probable rRNA maturation factor
MYQIDIQTELDSAAVPVERLTAAITDLLAVHLINRDGAVTVVIASDEYVRDLNKQFRGVDAPTDVLSFPADAAPPPPDWLDAEDEALPYLGDMVIAYPYTVRQAAELGHRLDDELTLLVIHGTLHLLGYDHDTPEHQAEMWAIQAEALALANVAIVVPRFTFTDSDVQGYDSET